MLTRSTSSWMDDQRKDHFDPKGLKQRNCSKQLQTRYLPTYDVENIYSTSKERDLLRANKPWVVPWGAEWMLKRIQRLSRVTLHRSTYPKWEQDQTEKSSYSLDWQQNDVWFGSSKLDNKLPQNVQNTKWSHKLYQENHENLESGIDCRRKKLSWNKDPKMYISRRCTIIVTIHNCHDAT